MTGGVHSIAPTDSAGRLDLSAIDGRMYNGLRVLVGGDRALVAPTYLVEAECQLELASIYGMAPPRGVLESTAPLAVFPVVAMMVPIRYLIGTNHDGATVKAALVAAIRNALLAKRAVAITSTQQPDWNPKGFAEALAQAVIESSPVLDAAVTSRLNPTIFADVALAVIRSSHRSGDQGRRDLLALGRCLDSPMPAPEAPGPMRTLGDRQEVLGLLDQFRTLWG